jgi:hypothetical protein
LSPESGLSAGLTNDREREGAPPAKTGKGRPGDWFGKGEKIRSRNILSPFAGDIE